MIAYIQYTGYLILDNILIAAAIFGAFVLGTYLGWCSPVQPQLKANSTSIGDAADEESVWHLRLDEDQMSWVGSLINVGAMFGALCGGVLMDRFGRKMILVAVFLFYTAGWLFITLAVDPSKLASSLVRYTSLV